MSRVVSAIGCLLLVFGLFIMDIQPAAANPAADLIGELEVNEVYTNIANKVVVIHQYSQQGRGECPRPRGSGERFSGAA